MQQPFEQAKPILRLFVPDEADEAGGAFSGSMPTLCEVFDRWYEPIVMISQRDNAASTRYECRRSLEYWREATGDPPLDTIDDFTIKTFVEFLRSASFSRGKVGLLRPLSKFTQQKHLANVRAVLMRCGPTLHPDRPGKGLIEVAPRVPVKKQRCRPGKCFTVETARAAAAAAGYLERPALPGVATAAWWQALLGLLFFTGLRIETVRRLSWRNVVQRDDGPWLVVESEQVPKTHKFTDVALHAEAYAAICRIRRPGCERLIPPAHSISYWRTLHQRLQRAGGTAAGAELPFKAWRIMHGTELARLGTGYGIEIARRSLDHSDVRTTIESYVPIEAEMIRKLPSILPASDSRQLRLF